MTGPSISNYDKYNQVSAKPTDNILYLNDVLFALKMSKTTLYSKISEGIIPKPKGKWTRKSYWLKTEIDKFLNDSFKF